MAGIGIGINVDARQVAAAKVSIEKTKDALQHLGEPVELAGKTGLKETSVLVKRLSDDINRLKGIAFSSDKQGGLLNAKQFQEAATISAKLGKNMADFAAQVGKVRQEITKLKGEIKTLDQQEYNSDSPQERSKIEAKRRQVQRRLKQQQKRYGQLEGQEDQFQGEFNEYTTDVQNSGMEKQQPRSGLGIKKALGYGAALLGGFSIMSFLQDSMAKSGAMDVARTDLSKRGANYGFGGATGLGFSPVEEAMLADSLSRRTGWEGKNAQTGTTTSMQFARTFGIEGEAAASFMGGTKTATGMNADEYKSYMRAIKTIASDKGTVESGRIEEYMKVNQQILTQVSGSSGGAGVGKETSDFIAALQGKLWSQGGVGQNSGIISGLNNSIASGGSSKGQQLFMWNAFGGQDAKGLGGYLDIKERMEEGASSRNIRDVIKRMSDSGLGTDSDSIAAQIHGLSNGSMTVTQSRAFAKTLQDASTKYGGIEAMVNDPEKWSAAFSTTEGALATGDSSLHRRTNAKMDEAKTEVGDMLLPLTDKFKEALIDSIHLLKGGEPIKAGSRFLTDNPLGLIMGGLGLAGGIKSLLPDVDVDLPGGKPAAAAAGATGASIAGSALSLLPAGGAAIIADAAMTGARKLNENSLSVWETPRLKDQYSKQEVMGDTKSEAYYMMNQELKRRGEDQFVRGRTSPAFDPERKPEIGILSMIASLISKMDDLITTINKTHNGSTLALPDR
jgi:hypothetical protein